MTYVLLAFVCLALGWFAGVYVVTRSLRADIADLEADRLQLDIDREQHLEMVEALLVVEQAKYRKRVTA